MERREMPRLPNNHQMTVIDGHKASDRVWNLFCEALLISAKHLRPQKVKTIFADNDLLMITRSPQHVGIHIGHTIVLYTHIIESNATDAQALVACLEEIMHAYFDADERIASILVAGLLENTRWRVIYDHANDRYIFPPETLQQTLGDHP